MKKMYLKCRCGTEMIVEESDELYLTGEKLTWVDEKIKEFYTCHSGCRPFKFF